MPRMLLVARKARSQGRLTLDRLNQLADSLLHTGRLASAIMSPTGPCSELCRMVGSARWPARLHSVSQCTPLRSVLVSVCPQAQRSSISVPGMSCNNLLHSMTWKVADGAFRRPTGITLSQSPPPIPRPLLNHEASTSSPALTKSHSSLSARSRWVSLERAAWVGQVSGAYGSRSGILSLVCWRIVRIMSWLNARARSAAGLDGIRARTSAASHHRSCTLDRLVVFMNLATAPHAPM